MESARRPPSLTTLLDGSSTARERLWETVYDELRQLAESMLAREQACTLQPTALVNEVFLRLDGSDALARRDRRYFFGAAANAMRRIVIERARRLRRKRERSAASLPTMVDDQSEVFFESCELLLDMESPLDELATRHAAEHEVLMFRLYGGRSIDQIAEITDTSRSTVKRRWVFALAFVQRLMDAEQDPNVNPDSSP